MSWQHPFITIDQNELRDSVAIGRVLDECCRNKWQVLIPDGAFLEFSKSGHFLDTTRRSLTLLAPYRELVCVSLKLAEMRKDELSSRTPSPTLVNEPTTKFLRSMLAELDRSEDFALRKLAEGPVAELMPAALDVWNDHDAIKRMIQGIHDAIKASMPPEELKALRQSPEDTIPHWLSSLERTRFVYQSLIRFGADASTACVLTRTPSVSAGFLSGVICIAIYWIAYDGIAGAKATAISGDLNDLEYVVLGALSRSLATRDRRASTIHRAVVSAFEERRSLPPLQQHSVSKSSHVDQVQFVGPP